MKKRAGVRQHCFWRFCFVLFLLIPYFQGVFALFPEKAEAAEGQSLVASSLLNASVQVEQGADGLAVQLHYEKAASEAPRRVRFRVYTTEDLTAEAVVTSDLLQLENSMETNQENWIKESAFSTEQETQDVHFLLPAAVANLQIAFQVDEEETIEGVTSIKADLLSAQEAALVTVALPESTTDTSDTVIDDTEKSTADTTASSEEAADSSQSETPAALPDRAARANVFTLESGGEAIPEGLDWNSRIEYIFDEANNQIILTVYVLQNQNTEVTQVVSFTPSDGFVTNPISTGGRITQTLAPSWYTSVEYTLSRIVTVDEMKSGSFPITFTIDNGQGLTYTMDLTLILPVPKTLENDSIEALSEETLDAYGLQVSETVLPDLLMNVTKSDGTAITNAYSTDKVAGVAAIGTYDGQAGMENTISHNYVAGSSARAVFFTVNETTGTLDAKIQLDYPDIGAVVSTSGEMIEVGAYVEITNVQMRSGEWGTDQLAALDFSNNFYSGISLTNVKSFDWDVTFYDIATRKKINFLQDGNTHGQLTFSSLNPGEFVNTNDPDYAVEDILYDAAYVDEFYFQTDTRIPADWNAFQSFNWSTVTGSTGEQRGYTAYKWGNWDSTVAPSDTSQWEDRLGAVTFGRGAVGFILSGTTHRYVRGTYSAGNDTWVANSSGALGLVIPTNPPLLNTKKVSTDAVAGGGVATPEYSERSSKPRAVDYASDAEYEAALAVYKAASTYQDYAASWVPDAASIDNQNINDLYAAGDQTPFYYYVSQELYSLASDSLILPSGLLFQDTLPEGVLPTGAVILYNTDGSEITLDAGSSLSVDQATRQVSMTLNRTDIEKLTFDRGYITVRIEVVLEEATEDLTSSRIMENTGTFQLLDDTGEVKYEEATNSVTVKQTPLVPNGLPLSVVKTSPAELSTLTGAMFTLALDGTPVATAITNSTGIGVFRTSDNERYTLLSGSYTITETRPLSGHVLDETVYAFTINDDLTIASPPEWLTITDGVILFHNLNTLKPFDILLEKNDANGQALAGATFTLTGPDVDAQAVSAADGQLAFLDVFLVPGETYRLTETQLPIGYGAAATTTWDLTLDSTGKLAVLTEVVTDGTGSSQSAEVYLRNGTTHNQITFMTALVNVKKTAQLTVEKRDEFSNQLLAGAEFTLTPGVSGAASQTVVTDTDGTAVFSDLDWQTTYTLEETKAPAGYVADSTSYTIFYNEETAEWLAANDTEALVRQAADANDITLTLTVNNQPKTALPTTGGGGRLLFALIGLAGAVVVGAYLWYRRCVKEVA